MPLQIVRNNIVNMQADAIVNAANPYPVIGSGVDSCIYKAAGADKLLAARKQIGPIALGQAAITPAYGLKAKYIIHAVTPRWSWQWSIIAKAWPCLSWERAIIAIQRDYP
ncbi:MAG: macro domain-containing protein [Phascolarctobacterium sp.]|nr:macro domain-containing protein [Phascolarctobacterium sp.]